MFQRKGFESLTEGTLQTSSGSKLFFHHTLPHDKYADSPVLVLLHGWPQTSYMWHHLIPPLISRGYRIFCPDLPGYGLSTARQKGDDRLTIGGAILEGVVATYGKGTKVIFVTHDRGARTTQFICTNREKFPDVNILAAALMDIVPYVAQWESFKNPTAATKYYHWPLLARTDVCLPMIKAYGGDNHVRDYFASAQGPNEKGIASLRENGAVEHFAETFANHSVLEAAAADYKAGATVDYDQQLEDHKAGKRVNVPTLILFSARNLGSMHDVPAIWKQWVDPSVELEMHAIGENAGHHFPEEQPEIVLQHVLEFLKKLGY